MLINAGKVILELNLSQLQCHPNTHNATLALASYCEPTLKTTSISAYVISICYACDLCNVLAMFMKHCVSH